MDHPEVEAWIKSCWSNEGGGHVRVYVDCLIELAGGSRIGARLPPASVKKFLRGPEKTAGDLPVYYSIPTSS
jgi:hypothetical protein